MSTFDPKWIAPPGATVLDLLQERGLALKDFATATDIDVHCMSRLAFGVEPLTQRLAERLAHSLGATPDFWLRREELYRADLRRLCGMSTSEAIDGWLKELPLREMVRFGWVKQGASEQETALNAYAFFGVATPDGFQRKFQPLLSSSAYSKTSAYTSRPSAVAAWMRQGEIAAAEICCAPWNEAKLRDSLDHIRKLTREKEPSVFLPRLEQLLADCGVAMVVVRAPEGCRASGITRFLSSEKALVQFSFRYLSDDQFWFTVFHEIGHLLLHAHDELFLEGLEDRHVDAEAEADDFAVHALLARVGTDVLDDVEISRFAIARLARSAGIAPGILVGQLQQKGRIPHKHFNYLKTRYAWAD